MASLSAAARGLRVRERPRRLPALELGTGRAGKPLAVSPPATAAEKSTVTVTVSGLAVGRARLRRPRLRRALGHRDRSPPSPSAFELPSGPRRTRLRLTTLGGRDRHDHGHGPGHGPVLPPTTPRSGRSSGCSAPRGREVTGRRSTSRLTCEGTVTVCRRSSRSATSRKVELRPTARRATSRWPSRRYSVQPPADRTRMLVLKLTQARPQLVLGATAHQGRGCPDGPGAVRRSPTAFWMQAAG